MTDPVALAARFKSLGPDETRSVHLALAAHAVAVWRRFVASRPKLTYVESVVGTRQTVDATLPEDALRSASAGADLTDVDKRYLEPLAALQDGDLELPEHVELAYYAVYNLFRKYARGADVDNWLIVNQALSADPDLDAGVARLAAAMAGAGGTGP